VTVTKAALRPSRTVTGFLGCCGESLLQIAESVFGRSFSVDEVAGRRTARSGSAGDHIGSRLLNGSE
jgi:hypothetical protein